MDLNFYNTIIKHSKRYIEAANINSLTTILQNIYLRENGFKDYNDIKQNSLDRFNNWLEQKRQKIQTYVNNNVNNKTYQSWIYQQIKNGGQQLQDIPKLVKQLQRLDNIKNNFDKLTKLGYDIKRKQFDISNFKTYGDLNYFVNLYYDDIKKDVQRTKIKNKTPQFPLLKTFGSYSLYKIGVNQEQQFKKTYGQSGWNTGWCVAQGTVDFVQYFDSYTPFYNLITIKNKPIALISLSDLQFKDVHDEPFSRFDKQLCDLIDWLLEENEIELDQIDQSELVDFEGYFLRNKFNKDKQYLQFSESKQYNSITVYKRNLLSSYKQYYLQQNSQLKLVLSPNRNEVIYHAKFSQQFVDDLLEVILSCGIMVTRFMDYNLKIFKDFNIDEYVKIIINREKNFSNVCDIFKQHPLSQQIQIQFVKKLTEHGTNFDLRMDILNKFYQITKNIKVKQIIESFLLTNRKFNDLLEQLFKNKNNTEKVNSIFDYIISKQTNNYYKVYSNLLDYIQYADEEHQIALADKMGIDDINVVAMLIRECKDGKTKSLLVDSIINNCGQTIFNSLDFIAFLLEPQYTKLIQCEKFVDQNYLKILANNFISNTYKIMLIQKLTENQLTILLKCRLNFVTVILYTLWDKIISFGDFVIYDALKYKTTFNQIMLQEIIQNIDYNHPLIWELLFRNIIDKPNCIEITVNYLIKNKQNGLLETLLKSNVIQKDSQIEKIILKEINT